MTPAALWGRRILVLVSVLLLVNGVGLYLVVVDTHVERTIGVLLAALAAFALAVTVDGLRHGSVTSWRTSWILMASLAALGGHSLRGDRADVPALYLGLAGIALLGQVLARPSRS